MRKWAGIEFLGYCPEISEISDLRNLPALIEEQRNSLMDFQKFLLTRGISFIDHQEGKFL